MVLISKGNTYTRVIGLLETLWMVVEALIDTRICASLQFHDALNSLRSGRGTGTAIMKLNLSQDLARVDYELLLLVLLYIGKA